MHHKIVTRKGWSKETFPTKAFSHAFDPGVSLQEISDLLLSEIGPNSRGGKKMLPFSVQKNMEFQGSCMQKKHFLRRTEGSSERNGIAVHRPAGKSVFSFPSGRTGNIFQGRLAWYFVSLYIFVLLLYLNTSLYLGAWKWLKHKEKVLLSVTFSTMISNIFYDENLVISNIFYERKATFSTNVKHSLRRLPGVIPHRNHLMERQTGDRWWKRISLKEWWPASGSWFRKAMYGQTGSDME